MKSTTFIVCVALSAGARMWAQNDEPSIQVVGHTVVEAGQYRVSFGDSYIVSLSLDRDYLVLAAGIKGKAGVLGYVLAPPDDNSALSVSFGDPMQEHSDAEISRAPGFTRIEHRSVMVGSKSVTFRVWSDALHTYSDGVAEIAVSASSPTKTVRLALDLMANSTDRISALEQSLASLRVGVRPNQLPDPTSPSVTRPAGAGHAPSVTADH